MQNDFSFSLLDNLRAFRFEKDFNQMHLALMFAYE